MKKKRARKGPREKVAAAIRLFEKARQAAIDASAVPERGGAIQNLSRAMEAHPNYRSMRIIEQGELLNLLTDAKSASRKEQVLDEFLLRCKTT